MARIVIIVGHALSGTYCGALAEAYMRGAEGGGHQVSLFNTASMTFDPILRGGYRTMQALEPYLAAARAAIQAAAHMCSLFPFGSVHCRRSSRGSSSVPFSRIFSSPRRRESSQRPRVERQVGADRHDHEDAGLHLPLVLRAHALKMLKRSILGFLGVSPIRSTVNGSIEGVSG